MGVRGSNTHREILQQPGLWPDTVGRVLDSGVAGIEAPVITGAGTSAYAALAIEPAWPGARAIASTELLLGYREAVDPQGTVLSLARSGDSPESTAVVSRIQRAFPKVRHVAITSNQNGALAKWPGVEAIVLDERTNDRSLVMTSSYSNLVFAGLALARPEEVRAAVPVMSGGWDCLMPEFEAKAKTMAAEPPSRAIALASAPLFGAAREACLKMLESTAGQVAAIAETYLGLRHGPMSFVRPDTIVLCFLSSDPDRRRYELDLVRELRGKGLGRLIAAGDPGSDGPLFDEAVTTPASGLPDYLRSPAEIVFPQLLAFHLSLRLGLDPDSPSPGGVINRVVQGVTIYD